MIRILLTYLFLCGPCLCLETVPEVFIAIGWRRINLLHENRKVTLNMIFKNFGLSDISVKRYQEYPDLHDDIPIAIVSNQDFEVAQQIIQKRPSESVMLVSNNSAVLESFKKVQFVKSFYYLHLQEMELKLIITSRHKSTLIQNLISLSLLPQPNKKVHYDLQGTKVDGITLDWWPYNQFGHCIKKNKYCQMTGVIPRLLTNLGQMYNFSMQYDRESNGKWGTQPIKGTFLDQNATFEGIFGAVINESYDIAPTSWNPNYERSLWLDFTQSFLLRKYSLIFNLHQKNLYWFVFLAPFTHGTWIGVLTAVFLLLLSRAIINRFHSPKSKKIVEFTGWFICFLFIHAIYGGMLTTQLSSPAEVPFESLEEGILLHPKWNLCLLKGIEGTIKKYADRGKPGFAEFWTVLQSTNDEHICNNIKEALRCIKDKAGSYLYIEEAKVALFANENIDFVRPISFASVETKKFIGTSLLLAKGSPYTKIFNQ